MKGKISEIKIFMQTFLKEKKLLALLVIGVIVLLIVIFVLLGGKNKGATSDESSSSESSAVSDSSITSSAESSASSGGSEPASTSSGSTADAVPAPPKAVIVTGTNINSAGLCIVVPTDAGIKDPNIPASKANAYPPVTASNNGSHSEVSLHFSDNVVTKNTMTILCLQAFNLGDALPELATYKVSADMKSMKSYSYEDISDKILYNVDGLMVIDVTFAKENDPKTVMEQYIAEASGKQLGHTASSPLTPDKLLADGTYIYKYDWMMTAFDYVRQHIKDLIAPIHYATPYSLDELGYILDVGSANSPPYLTAVSAETVRLGSDDKHSGMYNAPVYGGERLFGRYTVLQPTFGGGEAAPSNPSSFALLQAFKRSDIENQEAAIKFLRRDKPFTSDDDYFKIYSDGPFGEFSLTADMLKNYIIYSDDNIVVYDFFGFAKPPALEDQLKRLSNTEGYEQYGIKTDGVAAARRRLLETEGGLGRYIGKKQ